MTNCFLSICFLTLILWQGTFQTLCAQTGVETASTNKVDFTRQPVSLIPPGTTFGEQPPEDWSHLISFVRGQLTRGDVDAVTDTVRYYAEVFNLTMLANAEKNSEGKFELDQVAVGFSMVIDGKNVVVTSQTQSQLGGELSLIGRSVLDGNVAALAKVERVARTPYNLILDAPASMLQENEHREMIVRYYIWVFPENGNIGTLVWLLDPVRGKLKIADTAIQLLPPNMQEDRIMNVKKDKFNFLGIPSKDAFALVQIPQGTPFEMSEEMQSLAAETTYTPETLQALTTAIAKTLQSGRKE
ncbi:pyruvate kinase [Neorhodopirellula pilleata]|uniref:DUF4384 domain-containing protein n=1 Tax=Neorhodopirellula pilleata TaxID=2714738 RepID=A0A5C5ZPZ5_9BACT|nr:pyruvate kinase [Neorhodopirellula pilleata]TWT89266.1 hypothetical protein Pla100_55830 [Neorhodopirellula pilleata]